MRLSPTIAIGALMFFLGAAVSAGAAKFVTSKDIKNGTIQLVDISKKARASLSAKAGPKGATGTKGATGETGPPGDTGDPGDFGPKGDAGATGATGATGPQGAGGAAGSAGTNGTPGAAGVAGPAIVSGSMAAENRWSSPGSGSDFGSEPNALVPVPADSSFTAKAFIATVATPPGAGRSVTITLRANQADTALTCTISGATDTSCTPPSGATAVIAAGSKLSMHTVATGGSPSSGTIAYAYRGEF